MSDNLVEWKDLYNKGLIDDKDFLTQPFQATVVARLKRDLEYRKEVIKEIIQLIEIGELKTAQVLLNEVIGVGEVDK